MSSHNGEALREFWANNGDAIETLGIYAGGILVYALLVNFFYQIISKRVMFGGTSVDGEVRVGGPLHGFLYLFLFPAFSFAFFLLLSVALIFLGPEDQDSRLIFTLAMAVVLAVRVAAYFSEATSHDVAKMLPLGLLGVVLVTAELANFADSVQRLLEMWDHIGLILLYFGVVIVVEYLLRSVYLILHVTRRTKTPPKPPRPPRPSGAHGAEKRRP